MTGWLPTVAVGFVSGTLSGMFGIGGGIVTTPALRILLGTSALVAVGTPLPVILPAALTGAIVYARRGLADLLTGLAIGLSGSPFTVAGALIATRVGGRVVLVTTSLLIVYMAIDMTLQAIGANGNDRAKDAESNALMQGTRAAADGVAQLPRPALLGLVLLGGAAGLYSGFLGLGGGFILVPMLSRLFRFPIKCAVATSLVAVGILAVPGSVSHYVLGNVDLRLAALLIVGVIPGALVGARITLGASDRFVRIGFAILLAAVGAFLGAGELGLLA